MARRKFSISVDEEIYQILEEQAKFRSLTVYTHAGDLVTQAALNTERTAADKMLAPHIRKVVVEELKYMSNQMKAMQLRSYMEAGAARRMIQVLLSLSGGLDDEVVARTMQVAWDKTYADMAGSLDGLPGWRTSLNEDDIPSKE